jgi:hypothetical protein
VLRALDKDPTRRWPSVVDFSRALRDWQQGAPRQAEVFEQPTSPPPRGSLAPTIVILVLVIGALAALLWTGFRNLPTTPANEAPATVLVPPEPVITGEFDDDEPAGAAIEPTDVPQQDVAPRTAPTIAPAADTTTAQAQDSVTVPNLVGLTISGATQALGPLGLRIVPGQPMFTDSIPFNAVAAQDPPAGTVVSAGESIRVSLSRGPSPFGNDDAP